MNPKLSENAMRDLKLVWSVRSGKMKAFEPLMDHYGSAIYFLILKIVKFKEIAIELTSEVFEKALLNIHQYEPDFAFSSWLFRIAHNHAIDYLRRKKVVECVHVPSEILLRESKYQGALLSNLDNPEEAMIKYENAKILRKIVSDLNPRYRVLLEMHYFGEYSYAEMASELKLPIGTIKVQLFRSRKVLFELLKNSEIS